MTTNELKERYVYAATKRLPRKSRQDIAMELDSLVEDMILERCGAEPPTEKDLRVVFAEIGQPAELHRKYSPRAEAVLIGPPYYEPYLFVLKIVAACTAAGITVAYFLTALMGAKPPSEALLDWAGSLLVSLCCIFTFMTLMFAAFSRRRVDMKDFDDEINSLPPVPKANTKVSRTGSIVSIVLGLFFTALLLTVPEYLGFIQIEGVRASFLNGAVIRAAWFWIVAFTALGIIRESMALIEGRFTRRLLVTTLVTDGLSILCAGGIFLRESIVNVNALAVFLSDKQDIADKLTGNMGSMNLLFFGIFAFAILIDAGDAIYKYCKSQA